MFQFANPHILWLLLAIPAMAVTLIAMSQLRKRNLAKFGNIHILQELMPEISQWRVKTKSALFLTAVASIMNYAQRDTHSKPPHHQTFTNVPFFQENSKVVLV